MVEKHILLVEDERELRELLAIGLRRAGYTVDVAATAADAQQLIETTSYALVIADWLLPDGNGIDLADRALQHGAKTLIISGYLIGLPAGAAERHRLLRKPFSIDDLVLAVQNRIENPNGNGTGLEQHKTGIRFIAACAILRSAVCLLLINV